MECPAIRRRTRALLLATAAALAAAPCVAQEAVGAAAEQDDNSGRGPAPAHAPGHAPGHAPDQASAPRSAFGQVMSLLLAELERNADTPGATPATETPLQARASSQRPTPERKPLQQIQVGAKFRLDAARLDTAPMAAKREPLADNSATID